MEANLSQSSAAELPANRILERIIVGRTIQAVAPETTPASITFVDGSVMKIKTGAPLPAEAPTGKTVQKVRQAGLRLELEFTDHSRATISLAEETSSVLLRDGQGTFEYAD
jgi:hypothetical protein